MAKVHLLNDDRGAALEAVVSRMKTIRQLPTMAGTPCAKMRFIAASATMCNPEDVGEWLGAPRTHVFHFNASHRPVRLDLVVQDHKIHGNPFQFDAYLDFHLLETIARYSQGKPTLIFGAVRRGVAASAVKLSKEVARRLGGNPFITSVAQRQALARAVTDIEDRALAECVATGVAFHHAALDRRDRKAVESLFIEGHVRVVCCTSTLATGVNLPAHLVIVKSTQMYKNGRYEEYSIMDLMQMIGRAGRPG